MIKVRKSLLQMLCIFVAASSLALIGCVQHRPIENNHGDEYVPQQTESLQHTIKYQGETYALIARWYTGDSRNWKVIADANPTVKPTRMRLGDVIVIPRAIVKQDKPLPKDFVSKSVAAVPVVTEQATTEIESTNAENAGIQSTPQVGNAPEDLPTQQKISIEQPITTQPSVAVPPQQAIQKGPLLEDEDLHDKTSSQQPAPTARPVDAIGPTQTIGQPNNEEDANKAKLLNELLD